MTEYAILLPGDEAAWATATPEQREATYGRHREFAQALEARGHKVVGGAELVHSSAARTVRASGGGHAVTEGPYAESVEQLTGFYLVASDDLDDLTEVAKILADAEGGVEIRACVDHSADGGPA
jgi:hypothetical protein